LYIEGEADAQENKGGRVFIFQEKIKGGQGKTDVDGIALFPQGAVDENKGKVQRECPDKGRLDVRMGSVLLRKEDPGELIAKEGADVVAGAGEDRGQDPWLPRGETDDGIHDVEGDIIIADRMGHALDKAHFPVHGRPSRDIHVVVCRDPDLRRQLITQEDGAQKKERDADPEQVAVRQQEQEAVDGKCFLVVGILHSISGWYAL
jgi:hypothetical protein